MEEIELRRRMIERGLSVIGDELTSEEKKANMVKALFIILPPKSVSDRTTLRNIVNHYAAIAKSKGEQTDSIFKIIIDFALEASGPFSRVPMAVFVSILKKEFGYKKEKDNQNER